MRILLANNKSQPVTILQATCLKSKISVYYATRRVWVKCGFLVPDDAPENINHLIAAEDISEATDKAVNVMLKSRPKKKSKKTKSKPRVYNLRAHTRHDR